MNLSDEQARLALYAVTDLLTRRQRGGQSVPAGFYRFRQQLDASVNGSENDMPPAELVDGDEYLIDTTEAAQILGCSDRWVRTIRNDLDGLNIGGRWVFRRHIVVEYAEMRRTREQHHYD